MDQENKTVQNEESSSSEANTSRDTNQVEENASQTLPTPETTTWSCDSTEVPDWTQEEVETFNQTLGEAFGWDVATKEQIEKTAKSLFICSVLNEPDMVITYEKFVANGKVEEFVKILDIAIESVWNGTDNEDEVEKEKYREYAKAALKAVGFKVQFNNPMHLQVLV